MPPGYEKSVSAALGVSPERLDDLTTWMAVHMREQKNQQRRCEEDDTRDRV